MGLRHSCPTKFNEMGDLGFERVARMRGSREIYGRIVNSEVALFASGESFMTARFEALEQAHTRSARSPKRGTEDVLQSTMEERINDIDDLVQGTLNPSRSSDQGRPP